MNKVLALFFCLAIAGISCQQPDPYADYAKDFCNCVQPFAALQERILNMDESTTEDEMSKLYADGQKADTEVQNCLLGLQSKYPDLDMQKEQEIMEALRKACPDIVKLMEESATPDMEMPAEMPAEAE